MLIQKPRRVGTNWDRYRSCEAGVKSSKNPSQGLRDFWGNQLEFVLVSVASTARGISRSNRGSSESIRSWPRGGKSERESYMDSREA